MMALNRSPESFTPTNKFYIFVPLVPTCDPWGGASFDPKGHNMNKIDKCLQGDATYQQDGHDGPVSLHWLIREIHSYQTLHCLGIGLKHKTPYKD